MAEMRNAKGAAAKAKAKMVVKMMVTDEGGEQ